MVMITNWIVLVPSAVNTKGNQTKRTEEKRQIKQITALVWVVATDDVSRVRCALLDRSGTPVEIILLLLNDFHVVFF